jgi:outer membrane protein OmpA-like peptidoglycan-associated protein
MVSRTFARNDRAVFFPQRWGSAMVMKIIMSGALLALPTVVSAQAGPVADKSPEQITCELTGDCEGFTQQQATREAGATRGFRFDAPTRTKAKTVPAAPYAAKPVAVAPKARVAVASPARTTQPGRSTLSINFASGSSAIAPSSLSQARNLALSLNAASSAGKRFIVAGHTDSVGGREYNLELSRRRAQALVDYLADNGVDRSRLQPEGYGFDKPVPGLGAKAAANRRVEIVKID